MAPCAPLLPIGPELPAGPVAPVAPGKATNTTTTCVKVETQLVSHKALTIIKQHTFYCYYTNAQCAYNCTEITYVAV